MPHLALVPLTGFRVREREMLELGMALPGLHSRRAALGALPALGLLTLAGLTPDHWTIAYHPAPTCDEELIETLVAQRPRLVAISALTASIDEAYRLSQSLRRRGVRTVLGGLHATVCLDEAAQHCDAVVVGEGEPVWRELLADAEAGSLKPVYRAAQHRTEPSWPLPRFDLLGGNPARFTLQTQRGCPLACEFCGASRLLGRFREKPADAVRQELAAIRAIDPSPVIELADDNTFAGGGDAEPLLAALQESGARWFTESDWRLGERPEVLARLAAAGCVQVLVGIESLVFRYPGMGRKQSDMNRIMDAVLAIQAAGVAVNGCFIVGADGETHQSLGRLTQFILDSPLADVQVTLQTPFPGTALHRRLKDEGRLLHQRGWAYYTLFDVTFLPDVLTVDELENAFAGVLRAVYSVEATARRTAIRRNIWRGNCGLTHDHSFAV